LEAQANFRLVAFDIVFTGFALFTFMVYVMNKNRIQLVFMARYQRFWHVRFSTVSQYIENLKAESQTTIYGIYFIFSNEEYW